MALKFINKLFSRYDQSTQSMIQPNDTLDLENLSKYTQIITNKENSGYKGLKRAFDEKLPVEITVSDENGQSYVVSGTISHYDEHYENYNHYSEESDDINRKDKGEKTPDDLFAKHSRKFRR